MDARDRLFFALDYPTLAQAYEKAKELMPYVGGFKIGFELQMTILVSLMTMARGKAHETLDLLQDFAELVSGKCFWDGKFNDIPNTVAGAARALLPLNPMYFNVHASIGKEAIKKTAAEKGNSKLLGVTVLTSLDEECVSIFGDVPNKKVLFFADLVLDAGGDGLICSPQEVPYIRSFPRFEGLEILTPAVRPLWSASNDQKRPDTPTNAILNGATRIIVGRPISQPPAEIGSSVDAAIKIVEEIEAAQAE